MTDTQKEIVANNFQKGIAASPHVGHAKMANIDIEMFPGSMKAQKRLLSMMATIGSAQTFTTNFTTGLFTAAGSLRTAASVVAGINFAGAAVYFTTTGTLPAGLSLNTVYFITYVSDTTFKYSTNAYNAIGGSSNNITDNGTGVHTIHPIGLGQFQFIKKDFVTGNVYAIDTNGRVWNTFANLANPNVFYLLLNAALDTHPADGLPLLQANGNGLQLFWVSDQSKIYLFAFRTFLIDYIEVTALSNVATPVWVNSWSSSPTSGFNSPANSNNPHYSLLGQNNIIYIGDGEYLASLMEVGGKVFNPTDTSTYNYNNQTLLLPLNEVVNCLEELGVNLLIGGRTFNRIYPYDRTTQIRGYDLIIAEKGIYRMKNLGNNIYIFAGRKGNIYISNGIYAKYFTTIPGYIKNAAAVLNNNTTVIWGDVQISNGAVLIGLSCTTTANSGIYRLYPDKRIVQDNTPYNGPTQVSSLYSEDDFYIAGSLAGLDFTDTNRPAAGTYAAVYHSPLYRVGDKTHKAVLSQAEVQMGTPAANGDLRISYRFDKISNFTVANNYVADGVTTSFQIDEIGIENIENIQFQLEWDGDFEVMQLKLTP